MGAAWSRPRMIVAVAVLDLLVVLGGVGSVARYRAGYPLSPLHEVFGRDTTATGRRELRTLRRDPVLDVRLPGTRLRSVWEVAAGRDLWNADQPTEIRQRFDLDGEPGDAVERYRQAAEAAGWRWVESRCEFSLRASSALLTREASGIVASLKVYAHLGRPPPDSPRPGLLVVIRGEPPNRPPQDPATADRRWRDPHCLRGLDPASPDLVAPTRVPTEPAALCALLPLAEAARVVAVRTAVAVANAGPACRYEGPERFTVVAAMDPRAFYEDRRHEAAGAPRRAWFLLDDSQRGTVTGAWADTRLGPVRVHAAGVDAERLDALAALLART